MANRKGTIFISYAKEDLQHANSLYFDLKRRGLKPWMADHDLLPGQEWDVAIRQEIRESDYFLALLSSRSVTKRGYIQRELRLALDALTEVPGSEIFLIPVRLDDCEPSYEELRKRHWVDLFPSYEAGFEKLFRFLRPSGLSFTEPELAASQQRRGRVLIVDDVARWREELRGILAGAGFQVECAADLKGAREALRLSFFHVAVLDLSLIEHEQEEQAGMLLLQEIKAAGLQGVLQVVILSGFASYDRIRSAFLNYDVLDFISKQEFDEERFVKVIRSVFDRGAQINLGLIAHWQEDGPATFLSGLSVQGEQLDVDLPLWERACIEFEDLLCRLFFEAERVLIRPSIRGRAGRGLLEAQPVYANGVGRTVTVKYGDSATIAREHQNFETYVRPLLGAGCVANLTGMKRTPLLGGIAYLPGSSASERFEDFASFYRRSTAEDIRRVLDILFLDALSPWYSQTEPLQEHDFAKLYDHRSSISEESLALFLSSRAKIDAAGEEIVFPALKGLRRRNPLRAAGLPAPWTTYVSITHGHLSERSILLDERGNPWLMDFAKTGPGHVLRDLVELDAAIRIRLFDDPSASLEERLALEETLASIDAFAELGGLSCPTHGSQAFLKAWEISRHLRSLAGKLVARNPAADLREYHLGSLYAALCLAESGELAAIQRLHALVAGAVLASRLGL